MINARRAGKVTVTSREPKAATRKSAGRSSPSSCFSHFTTDRPQPTRPRPQGRRANTAIRRRLHEPYPIEQLVVPLPVTVTIRDRGRGFEPDAGSDYEAAVGAIHDLLEPVGATATTWSEPDGGTRVTLRLPTGNHILGAAITLTRLYLERND